MKNKLVLIIVTSIVLIFTGYTLSFFSVIFTDSNDENAKENLEVTQIELTFWRANGTNLENRAYSELISDFEKAHPNIKIKMELIPYGNYELKLRTEIAAGNPPDIMAIDSPNLALYANSGSLLSIDEKMRQEGNIIDIPATTLNGMIFNNEIYLAPIVESGLALFYSMQLFREADLPFPSNDPYQPMTWEEVLEIAKKINQPENGVYGIDPAQGFADGEAPAYFKLPILWQFGAEVLNLEATTADGFLNSNEALAALQFYQDLYHKYQVAPIESLPNPLVNGKVGMTVLGSWYLEDLKKNFPDFKLGEDFGIAPLPIGKNQVAPNGGWALGISSKTKYPEEAWQFIHYLTNDDGAKNYVEVTGDLPARYTVANQFPELNEYPKNIFVIQAQNFAKNRPITPVYPVVSEAIKTLFEDVGIGKKDVKISADEAVEKINASLNDISR